MKYDMTPIGTMNHFFIEFIGSQFGYNLANQMAMEVWSKTYRGDLGTFLTDTYTTQAFFNNLDKYHALLYNGVRQDSGDEYKFIVKALTFYRSKGIDPMTKTIVFSNALDFPKAVEIKKYCENKIKASFGIGTNLTCDVYDNHGNKYGHENEVMKMIRCRMNKNQPWYLTIKISDDIGKHMGDNDEFNHACYELEINLAA